MDFSNHIFHISNLTPFLFLTTEEHVFQEVDIYRKLVRQRIAD